MNDEEFMYILEAIAYISATIAAFVYVWETCFPTKKIVRYNESKQQEQLIPNNRRSSSSLYDDF